jgi:hypothetical protein
MPGPPPQAPLHGDAFHCSDHAVDARRSSSRRVWPLTCTGPTEDCRWLQLQMQRTGGSKRGGGGTPLLPSHSMFRVLTLLALLAGPADAQSVNPSIGGPRYCQLRESGISHDQALTVAIRDSLDLKRVPVMVVQDGKPVSLDVVDFARVVVRCRG